MADLNETEAARVALDQVWRELAPVVDEAKALQEEAARNPSRLSDPSVDAQIRWLTVFNRELVAVQTVHETVEAGGKLSADEIRAARQTGQKLLDVIRETRESASSLAVGPSTAE